MAVKYIVLWILVILMATLLQTMYQQGAITNMALKSVDESEISLTHSSLNAVDDGSATAHFEKVTITVPHIPNPVVISINRITPFNTHFEYFSLFQPSCC